MSCLWIDMSCWCIYFAFLKVKWYVNISAILYNRFELFSRRKKYKISREFSVCWALLATAGFFVGRNPTHTHLTANWRCPNPSFSKLRQPKNRYNNLLIATSSKYTSMPVGYFDCKRQKRNFFCSPWGMQRSGCFVWSRLLKIIPSSTTQDAVSYHTKAVRVRVGMSTRAV